MVPELEKPRVTEIQVRIDCNGCVQKIKKALHGINGIYDVTMDVPQQKLRIIGWADPERIVKAIRKTRKTATICLHAEQTDPAAAQSADQKPESSGPPQEAAEPHPPQAPPTEHVPPAEPPKDQPPSAPLPEKPVPSQEIPPPEARRDAVNDQQPPDIKPQPKDVGEVRMMYRHPQNYGYRYHYHNYEYCDSDRVRNEPSPSQPQRPPSVHMTPSYNTYEPSPYVTEHGYIRYPGSHRFRNEPPPPQPQRPPSVHVTHSYNTYEPSPYVTEYEYIRSPPRFSHYRRMDRDQDYYGEDYRISSSSRANGNITSIFSDENPNACRIM